MAAWRCWGRRVWRFGTSPESDRGGHLVGVPEGVQGWSRGRGQMGRVLQSAAPRWDGVRVAPVWPFPVPLGLPATPHGGFFPTLRILCAALWAARILRLEPAWELRPVSVLPWADGPAGCLARERSGG